MTDYPVTDRPVPGAVGYRIAGIIEAVAALPLAALWLLSGIGVGFCSDGHGSAYCDGLSRVWMAFGASAVACALSGLAMVAVARQPQAGAAKLLVTVAYGVSAISALAFGAWLVSY